MVSRVPQAREGEKIAIVVKPAKLRTEAVQEILLLAKMLALLFPTCADKRLKCRHKSIFGGSQRERIEKTPEGPCRWTVEKWYAANRDFAPGMRLGAAGMGQ